MNRVILLGRLTKEPETKFTQNNKQVTTFGLAVNRAYTKQGEERKADFFNIIAWGRQAEFASKYFQKGLQVAVEGRIENRSWDDQEGKKHYITEIIADNMHFADSKSTGGQQQQYKPNQSQNQPTGEQGFSVESEDESDLPF